MEEKKQNVKLYLGHKLPWETIGEDAGAYLPSEHGIVFSFKEITTFDRLCIVLHELGHAHYKHRLSDMPIKREIEAWKYALDCIKPQYHRKMIDHAIFPLYTYNLEVTELERHVQSE